MGDNLVDTISLLFIFVSDSNSGIRYYILDYEKCPERSWSTQTLEKMREWLLD